MKHPYPSYLTARPSRDIRAAAWQQLTVQWWEEARARYELFTSELVFVEASRGDTQAATQRLACLNGIPELTIDDEVRSLAARFIADGGMPPSAQADALHAVP